MARKGRIVIKLSGSTFAPAALPRLGEMAAALARAPAALQPIAVAGGGEAARTYISHARAAGADESALDELGIYVSRLNARLLIHHLGARAHPRPPETLREAEDAAATGRIVVAGGLYPGQSTNGTAALLAERLRAVELVNATDVDAIYDRDPNRDAGAKRLRRVTVRDLRAMLAGEGSMAGGYDLMDMIALKVIERSRMRARVIRSDPRTVAAALRGRAAGTEIIHGGQGTGRSRSPRASRQTRASRTRRAS